MRGDHGIEITAHDNGAALGDAGGLGRIDDLRSSVQGSISARKRGTEPLYCSEPVRFHFGAIKRLRPYLFRSSRAAVATRSALTRVMQRWSMGHSRLRHGLQSTGSRTTRARGPVGPVPRSSVAPKMATVG